MATLQLEDLLRDELAENSIVGDWECSLQSLFLKIDPTSLSRIRLRGIREEAPIALKNLDAWTTKAEEVGALARIDPYQELPKFRIGLEKVCRAIQGSAPVEGELRALYLALIEQIDEEVFQFLGRQDRFYKTVFSGIDSSDIEMRERLRETLASLEMGLSDVGIERCNHLRIAKREGSLIASMKFGEQCTPGCLMAAFADWKLSRSIEDCRRQLRRAWNQAQKDADEVAGPLGRFLGNLYLSRDEPELAWPVLQLAAEIEQDGGSILDAAKLAIRLHKWDQAINLVKSGIGLSSIFSIRILAENSFEEIAGDVLELLADSQREARKTAATGLSRWSQESNRVKQAAKTAAIRFDFLGELDQKRKALSSLASDADFFESLSLTHESTLGRDQCLRQASQELGALHHEATKQLNQAKAAIDHAWVEREAMIEAAVERQKQEVDEAREALQSSLKESDKNQSGCVLGLGSGCGAFVLYLFVAGILATRGINAGFGTIFGWFGLAASGVPIGLAIIAQLAYGTQRSVLDKALHEKIRLAQQAYESAGKQADKVYREEVLKLRDGLGETEARALRMEEGLKILSACA